MPDLIPIDVNITMSVISVGAALTGGEFAIRLQPEDGTNTINAVNDANGLVTFNSIPFTNIGVYNFTASVANNSANADDLGAWVLDTTIWPVVVDVYQDNDDYLQALVSYPDGVPIFINSRSDAGCGLFQFPELVFTAAGVYEYTLQELTPSGGGWIKDDSIIRVIVTVIDDGHGNLLATVNYPDGFPSFVNTYNADPARVIISGCKTAIGAPLPTDRFVFGLYDEDNNLVSSVTNSAVVEIDPELSFDD